LTEFHVGMSNYPIQGILSVPGIAGYEWVPARIGCFINTKYFFHNTNGQLKAGKAGTHLSADTEAKN